MKEKLLKITWVGMCLGLMLGGICYGEEKPAQPGGSGKPAILFSCPQENRYGYVGFDYMRELVKQGFEVDYIEGGNDFKWEKFQKFNVIVAISYFPPRTKDEDAYATFHPPPLAPEYIQLLDRFIKAGGGVFLYHSPERLGLAPNELLKPWGIQIPLLYLKDPAQTYKMSNMGIQLAWTDQILPSPVSEGVKQIWYPIERYAYGAMTMPIFVDENWKVVVRPSKTALADVPVFDKADLQPPKEALIPEQPPKDPVLFAIREFPNGGRMAAIQTLHQFSIGSGTGWLFNSEVVSKGLMGRPSDYGKLLINTYQWLAEPSMKSGTPGGYVTEQARLLEPQLRPGAINQFPEPVYTNYYPANEDRAALEYRPTRPGKIFKGIIGVETQLGGGKGAVSDYAGIAVRKGLDFIVFVDDIVKLTPEKFATLKAECAKHSATNLQLFAGYKMIANTGNRLFVFGPNPPWPPDVLLIGANKIFMLQYQDETGKFSSGKNPALDWCNMCTYYSGERSTLGYYDFSHSATEHGQGLAMHDLRVYSVAALRTYENGKLIDDALDDYLTTVQSTAVPTPVAMIIVRSPDELISALDAKLPLTYAQARSLSSVFMDALLWNCSYHGLNVFPSDGPIIHAWPQCVRVMIFGAEPFVTGRSLNFAPIHVTSDVGLKEIRIYNGRDLFRRFLFKGEKEFNTNLLLSGVVQRNLVLIAEDINGGKAVSFAHRSYKEGVKCPIFCADHCNDCGWMLLAHGPFWPELFGPVPGVPNAGGTWDGGPRAQNNFLCGQFTRPTIRSDQGIQDGAHDNQTPYLEFSDEGAVRCRSVNTETFPKSDIRGNPWTAFGPLIPTTLFDSWAAYAEYDQYLTGVSPNSYGPIGGCEGPVISLFTEEIKYKKDMLLQSMRLFHGGWRAKTLAGSLSLVFGKGSQIEDVLDATNLPDEPRQMEFPTGSWFGIFSSYSANSQLFINRGSPLIVELNPVGRFGWLTLRANLKDQPVKAGETWRFEIFSISWPLNSRPESGQEFVRVINYLDQPSGLKLTRGKRVQGNGGLFELTPDNHAIELEVPKPASQLNSILPLRISPLNKRWTAGLYQIEGYRTHYYSKSDSGWRELGLDFEGRAYVPLYAGKSNNTRVMIGHPVVADDAGKYLFIQVTKVSDGDEKIAPTWHVSVNNPGDQPVKCTLRKAMDVPGLDFNEQQITLRPGEYKVLVETKPPPKTCPARAK